MREMSDDLFVKATEYWDLGEYDEAFNLYKTAAEQGDASSQNNLGYFYDSGIGVLVDKAMAKYWYEQAIENGEICAYANLANLFLESGDRESAFIWLTKAMDTGDGDAAVQLAKLILEVDQSDCQKKAKQALKLALTSMSVTPDSLEEATELLKALNERG